MGQHTERLWTLLQHAQRWRQQSRGSGSTTSSFLLSLIKKGGWALFSAGSFCVALEALADWLRGMLLSPWPAPLRLLLLPCPPPAILPRPTTWGIGERSTVSPLQSWGEAMNWSRPEVPVETLGSCSSQLWPEVTEQQRKVPPPSSSARSDNSPAAGMEEG